MTNQIWNVGQIQLRQTQAWILIYYNQNREATKN